MRRIRIWKSTLLFFFLAAPSCSSFFFLTFPLNKNNKDLFSPSLHVYSRLSLSFLQTSKGMPEVKGSDDLFFLREKPKNWPPRKGKGIFLL